jgi:hypothetical protein
MRRRDDDEAYPNIFEICFNFESTLILASTPWVMRVFSVQSSGEMILPVLNP